MAVVGAGTQLINAIGIGSAILTTVGFIQGQIPEGAPAQGARVKIKGITSPLAYAAIQLIP